MTRKALGLAGVGAVLVLAGASAASAHHSFGAEFDQNAPVKLEGSVKKFEWVNPHSWIHINVAEPKTGKVVEWKVEGGAPSALLRRGWNRNSLPPGTKIIVTAFRSRDGEARASAADISFPDGQKLSLGNPQTESVLAVVARGTR
jgi:hypothetical protein